MSDQYHTLSTPSEALYRDRASKFLAFAYPFTRVEELEGYLEPLRKAHPKANHHCYAYRLGQDKNNYRANDDGEPNGTAGRPILGQIDSFGLTNVLIVVVRYFGGTLLGTSGLIEAYKESSKLALSEATIIEKTVCEHYEITFDYALMPDVMNAIKKLNLETPRKEFTDKGLVEVEIPRSKVAQTWLQFKALVLKISEEEAKGIEQLSGVQFKSFVLAVLFFLGFSISCFAQSTHQHNVIWFRASGIVKVSPKQSLELELIHRRQSFFEGNPYNPLAKPMMNAARIWYSYQPTKMVTLMLTPISIWHSNALITQHSDLLKTPQRELRVVGSEELKLPLSPKVELGQRNQLEFRFTRPVGATTAFSLAQRVRNRLSLKYTFQPKWTLNLADELFWYVGKNPSNTNKFDQNRLIFGTAYTVSPKLKLDCTFLLTHQKRKNIDDFDELNNLYLSVFYTFN